jgi:hypothetical protein
MAAPVMQGGASYIDSVKADAGFQSLPEPEQVQYLHDAVLPQADPEYAKLPISEQQAYIKEVVLPRLSISKPKLAGATQAPLRNTGPLDFLGDFAGGAAQGLTANTVKLPVDKGLSFGIGKLAGQFLGTAGATAAGTLLGGPAGGTAALVGAGGLYGAADELDRQNEAGLPADYGKAAMSATLQGGLNLIPVVGKTLNTPARVALNAIIQAVGGGAGDAVQQQIEQGRMGAPVDLERVRNAAALGGTLDLAGSSAPSVIKALQNIPNLFQLSFVPKKDATPIGLGGIPSPPENVPYRQRREAARATEQPEQVVQQPPIQVADTITDEVENIPTNDPSPTYDPATDTVQAGIVAENLQPDSVSKEYGFDDLFVAAVKNDAALADEFLATVGVAIRPIQVNAPGKWWAARIPSYGTVKFKAGDTIGKLLERMAFIRDKSGIRAAPDAVLKGLVKKRGAQSDIEAWGRQYLEDPTSFGYEIGELDNQARDAFSALADQQANAYDDSYNQAFDAAQKRGRSYLNAIRTAESTQDLESAYIAVNGDTSLESMVPENFYNEVNTAYTLRLEQLENGSIDNPLTELVQRIKKKDVVAVDEMRELVLKDGQEAWVKRFSALNESERNVICLQLFKQGVR